MSMFHRDTDVENKCGDTKGERRSGMNWILGLTHTHTHTHTHNIIDTYKTDSK